MKILTLKDFKWSFDGHVREFQTDELIEVDAHHASDMIKAGYAIHIGDKAENKMVTLDYENNPASHLEDNKPTEKHTSKENKEHKKGKK